MTMEYVQSRVNCRSTLGMLAGMMSHSKASLSTLTLFAMLSDTERASVPASIAESFQI